MAPIRLFLISHISPLENLLFLKSFSSFSVTSCFEQLCVSVTISFFLHS